MNTGFFDSASLIHPVDTNLTLQVAGRCLVTGYACHENEAYVIAATGASTSVEAIRATLSTGGILDLKRHKQGVKANPMKLAAHECGYEASYSYDDQLVNAHILLVSRCFMTESGNPRFAVFGSLDDEGRVVEPYNDAYVKQKFHEHISSVATVPVHQSWIEDLLRIGRYKADIINIACEGMTVFVAPNQTSYWNNLIIDAVMSGDIVFPEADSE